MADSENYTQVGGSNENASDTNQQTGPSDKQPWLICAYGFTSRVLIIGVLHGFGPFFITFLEEFKITKETSGNSPVFDFEALNSSTNLTKNTPNPCKKPVIST
jgi:hypothetical protein